MAVKIAIVNQKGGVSKSTSSIELAACVKAREYSALLVDMDQQADTTKYSGGDTTESGVYEVLCGDRDIKTSIQHTEEFDLLAASSRLSRSEAEFIKPTDVLKLKRILNTINDDYDFIIIDTNPGRNKLLQMAYIAADLIVIPTDADSGSIYGIKAVFEDLKEYKEAEWSNAEIVGIIFSRYENTGMHKYAEEQIQNILNEFESDAFLLKVRKGIAATECKAEGTSMQKGKRYSNPAIDYRIIADEIIDRILEGQED